MSAPKFGQWFRNTSASESNPIRDGMFVRTIRRSAGRMNAGTLWQLTDGHGKFWETSEQFLVELYTSPPAAPAGDDPFCDDWISPSELDARLETLAVEYEFGDEGYAPNERERLLLIDFAHGILADDVLIAMLKAHHNPIARGRPDTTAPASTHAAQAPVIELPAWPTRGELREVAMGAFTNWNGVAYLAESIADAIHARLTAAGGRDGEGAK